MSKLTLSVDQDVITRAKRYAKRRGTSVSQMVETYLEAVAEPGPAGTRGAPVLRALRGSLKSGDAAAYRKYLDAKHR